MMIMMTITTTPLLPTSGIYRFSESIASRQVAAMGRSCLTEIAAASAAAATAATVVFSSRFPRILLVLPLRLLLRSFLWKRLLRIFLSLSLRVRGLATAAAVATALGEALGAWAVAAGVMKLLLLLLLLLLLPLPPALGQLLHRHGLVPSHAFLG